MSADIIVAFQYTPVFKSSNGFSYLNYVKNHNGKDKDVTEINNDYNLKSENDNSPKQKYKNFINYLNRAEVTQVANDHGEKLSPLFNQDKFNLNINEEKAINQKLNQAADENALLWKGVVSFSEDFLIQEKILNPKNRHVDQQRLKYAIQKSMPKLLQNEGFASDSTWFGAVHLHGTKNKNHVHVHLGILDDRQQRPQMFNETTGQYETRGKLKLKSFERFKSDIIHQLRSPLSQAHELTLEKHLNTYKKDIKDKLEHQQNLTIEQQQLIQSILRVLPKDQKQWRAKSHANTMKMANELANQYIDTFLKQNVAAEYEQFKHDLQEQDEIYQHYYGEKKYRSIVGNRDRTLRQQLINQMYRSIKLTPMRRLYAFKQSAIIQQAGTDQAMDPVQIKATLSVSQNIVQQLNRNLKRLNHQQKTFVQVNKLLKKERGLQLKQIRLANLQLGEIKIQHKLTQLQNNPHPLSKPNQTKLDQYQHLLKFLQAEQVPHYQRTKEQQALIQQTLPLVKPIEKMTKKDLLNKHYFDQRLDSLAKERHNSQQLSRYERQIIYGKSTQHGVEQELQRQVDLLMHKKDLYIIEEKISQTQDPVQKQQLQKDQKRLAKQVRQLTFNQPNDQRYQRAYRKQRRKRKLAYAMKQVKFIGGREVRRINHQLTRGMKRMSRQLLSMTTNVERQIAHERQLARQQKYYRYRNEQDHD